MLHSLIYGTLSYSATSVFIQSLHDMDNLQHAIPEDSDFPIFLGMACKLNKWPLII